MADLLLHAHGEGDCLLLAKTAAELSISRMLLVLRSGFRFRFH